MTKSKLKELTNYDIIRGFQMRRVKQLNDFYIEVKLTIKGLAALQQNLSKGAHKNKYIVPGMRGGQKAVPRKTADILGYIDRRISYSEYAKSIVFVVVIAEDYIGDIIRSILMTYPKSCLFRLRVMLGTAPSI